MSEDDLLQLAFVAALGGEQELFDHLLSDGAASLYDAVLLEVCEEGPTDGEEIDPPVRLEGAVLGGKEGVLHPVGDVRDGDRIPPFVEELSDQGAVVGVDEGRGRRAVAG